MQNKNVVSLHLLLLIIFMGIIRCSINSTTISIYNGQCEGQSFAKVTFNEILDNPSEYDSKFIEIEGFYRGQFEQSALFKNRQVNKESNAFWVHFDESDSLKEVKSEIYFLSTKAEFDKIVDKRIKIRGIFDSKTKGHLAEYFGTLKDICYLEIL